MPENSSPDDAGGDCAYVSVPRGGPIFVPDMVGPLTRVPDCELSVSNELQKLKDELDCESLESWAEELSVNELKIITEEELVGKAFEEAFKEGESVVDSIKTSEQPSCSGRRDDDISSGPEYASGDGSGKGTDNLGSESPSSLSLTAYKGNKPNGNITQKGERNTKTWENIAEDESYMAKVEELARIKQQQDEDKRAARLHSFNGSSKNRVQATMSADKTSKMTSLRGSNSVKAKSSNACEHVEVHFPELVLCVEVYHNKRTWGKAQEFFVLGSQFLTELRDKIYCLTDEIMKKAGQSDSSGYFLIEDVFANDLRERSATNYSKPILDWLENSKQEALEKWDSIVNGELQQKQKTLLNSGTELQLPRFRSMEMQKVRFCDLRFRLGAGYLYCHQGDCKHVIVIRDMRLIHPEDVQNRAAYPLITYQSKLRFHKCSVCKIFRAQKFTVDDKWAPENPCYFCDLCYYMLHYVDGALLYNDFSVYDYFHE